MKILNTLPANEYHKIRFAKVAADCEMVYISEKEVTAADVENANIIIGDVDYTLLKHCKDLKLLQLSSAGTGNYVNPGVLPEGALLTCATGAYGLAISEYMLAVLLGMMKHLPMYYDRQKAHNWERGGNVTSIYGCTVLCVGAGDIGSTFAQKMKALGAYTIGVRRTVAEKPEWFDEMYTSEKLDELLPRADVVALSMPATSLTYRMIDRRRIELMKDGAYLINVGRGNAIDTDALVDIMHRGKLAGAALDVTDPEPVPAEHPLWDCPRVYITPHVSGRYTLPETLNRVVEIAAQNIEAMLSGGALRSEVSIESGYRKKD